jgi:hypothetical protein
MSVERKQPLVRVRLSNPQHLGLVLSLLCHMGAVCPKCGYGTRVTSKRWARCKREGCGERVERQALPSRTPAQEVQRG